MRLLRGRTTSGVGTQGICVDDAEVIAGGGTPGWVSTTQIVGQAQLPGHSVYEVITFNPTVGAGSAATLWPGEEGADVIMAGAGVVAAGLRSGSPYTRLLNTPGRTTLTGYIPWDVDRETGLAVLMIYMDGFNLHVVPKTSVAPTLMIPTGALYSARSVGGIVTWIEGTADGTRPFAYNVASNQPLTLLSASGNNFQAVVVTSLTGRRFLVYTLQDGDLVCHPIDDTTQGHKLAASLRFGMDAEVQTDGSLKVVWSTNAGESAGSQQSQVWSLTTLEAITITPGPPSTGGGGAGPVGGGSDLGSGIFVPGTITLTSRATFVVAGAAEELITLPIDVLPAFPVEGGHGRIVHPFLGAFDYEVKPDEWVNIDADAIIPPVWASTRTLTSAANVLWQGNLRDVVVEERWKALGGLAMPVTQFRMLLAIWTTPVDPDVGYVQWYPNYITNAVFKVLPVALSAGGQGITFDDVVNYKDEEGDPIGWMTNPVTFTLKIVGRV